MDKWKIRPNSSFPKAYSTPSEAIGAASRCDRAALAKVASAKCRGQVLSGARVGIADLTLVFSSGIELELGISAGLPVWSASDSGPGAKVIGVEGLGPKSVVLAFGRKEYLWHRHSEVETRLGRKLTLLSAGEEILNLGFEGVPDLMFTVLVNEADEKGFLHWGEA